MKKINLGLILLLLIGCGKNEVENTPNIDNSVSQQNYKSDWGLNNMLYTIPTGPSPSDMLIGCSPTPANCYDVVIIYPEEVKNAINLDYIIEKNEILDTSEYRKLLESVTNLSVMQIDAVINGSVTLMKVPNDMLDELSVKVYLAFNSEMYSEPIDFSEIELDQLLYAFQLSW